MAEAAATQESAGEAQAQADTPQAVEVAGAELPQAEPAHVKGAPGQVDVLLGLTVPIAVTLGQTEVQVRQLLEMGPGSVLKLDRRAGEPVDLYMKGVKFATGRLVVVGENLGVRVKEILPPAARGEEE